MNKSPILDGPRLLKPEEMRAAQILGDICFSDQPPSEAPLLDDGQPLPTKDRNWRRQGAWRKEGGETYIIAADGRLVSQISVFLTPLYLGGARLSVGSIGGVCTHPDYREMRLAGRLLLHCAQRLADGGAHVMVISGARGLYRRAGAVEMGSFYDFRLWAGKPLAWQGQGMAALRGVRVRRAQPSDAALAARLYQYETVHFARDWSAFTRRFEPHPIGFTAEEFIVEIDGRPLAYLLLNTHWDHMDQSQRRSRFVFEYAGSRLALAGAAPLVMAELGLDELHFPVAWQDTDLAHLLQASDPQPGFTYQPDHTIRILNFPGLMAALRTYLSSVLSPVQRRGLRFTQSGPLLAGLGEDRMCISLGGERLELDGAAMSALVFGDPSGQHSASRNGALGEILSAVFPLPSFNVGLNYH